MKKKLTEANYEDYEYDKKSCFVRNSIAKL